MNTFTHLARRSSRLALLIAGGGLIFFLAVTHGQSPVTGSVKGGFRTMLHDTQNRKKTLIEGKTAKSGATASTFSLTELHLETYRDDGQTDMVANAPECTLDLTARVASSAGPFQATASDGRLSISGEGFYYDQKNSRLVISNKVHTIIRRELLNAESK